MMRETRYVDEAICRTEINGESTLSDLSSSTRRSNSNSEKTNENLLFSEKERAFILHSLGRCYPCGLRTHKGGGPLTNREVYQGVCIRCNLQHFPKKIRRQVTHELRIHAK
uniref:Uncharacterized protein n=1 Tax=Amphora coffeiformis TaxID=265554 RepID=A0A7S3P8F3_9STRA|mmetsp:Transcript_20632/g.39191  ORF Transcript_20632/g.39191 Transcript_20632/m.39191 type:complete len:111 (+) Transcript_20632:49-381(+)